MAEIQYYALQTEAFTLAAHLVSAFDATIHVDDSPTNVLRTVRSESEIAALLDTPHPVPLLHITSPAWSTLPLQTIELKTKDGRRVFYGMQRYGGPAFLWSVPGVIRLRGRATLRVGTFGDWAWYYVRRGSTETILRPKAMERTFREVLRIVRRGAVRARWTPSGRAGPWISVGAAREIQAGCELAPGLQLAVL